jgi:serine protease Do
MNTPRSRHLATALLVVGAVVFGMVLAGGLELTTPASTSPETPLSATQLVSNTNAAVHALPSFADLAQAVDPAVVSIQAATIQKVPTNRRRGGGGGIDPFEFFFGPRNRQQQPGPQRQNPGDNNNFDDPEDFRSDAGGSGFVISPDGLVVTNYHVVEGASEVKVHLGERDYPAEVKGTDQATDIALLKVDAGRSLRYLELGDSDRTRVGDWVMVIGNPLNLDKTVTTGVISAKGRSLGINDISFENFLQTDAAINFGNSGGPLINMDGQVVGIATAINWGAENIGFAVPVNTLREILPQLRDRGKVSRGYLGISIGNVDYQTAEAFGLDKAEGALVGDVDADTPAGKAGVKHGDIILEVDGRPIVNTHDLINYVSAKGPNSSVDLTILRNGERLERRVKLGERPGQTVEARNEGRPGSGGIDWLGLQYQDLTGGLRSTHGLPNEVKGVWVTGVAPTSPLYDEGVRPGDVIAEINGQELAGAADLERMVRGAKPGSFLRLYVLRLSPQGDSKPQPFFAIVKVP